MEYTDQQVKEFVNTAMAYGSVVLARIRLDNEKERTRKSKIAAEILDETIPYYKSVVPREVQESLSVHLGLEGLEKKCYGLLDISKNFKLK